MIKIRNKLAYCLFGDVEHGAGHLTDCLRDPVLATVLGLSLCHSGLVS